MRIETFARRSFELNQNTNSTWMQTTPNVRETYRAEARFYLETMQSRDWPDWVRKIVREEQ